MFEGKSRPNRVCLLSTLAAPASTTSLPRHFVTASKCRFNYFTRTQQYSDGKMEAISTLQQQWQINRQLPFDILKYDIPQERYPSHTTRAGPGAKTSFKFPYSMELAYLQFKGDQEPQYLLRKQSLFRLTI